MFNLISHVQIKQNTFKSFYIVNGVKTYDLNVDIREIGIIND